MGDQKELMAVCPYYNCGKVIFRKGEIQLKTNSPPVLDLSTRCPHCGKAVRIKVGVEIKAEPVY